MSDLNYRFVKALINRFRTGSSPSLRFSAPSLRKCPRVDVVELADEAVPVAAVELPVAVAVASLLVAAVVDRAVDQASPLAEGAVAVVAVVASVVVAAVAVTKLRRGAKMRGSEGLGLILGVLPGSVYNYAASFLSCFCFWYYICTALLLRNVSGLVRSIWVYGRNSNGKLLMISTCTCHCAYTYYFNSL